MMMMMIKAFSCEYFSLRMKYIDVFLSYCKKNYFRSDKSNMKKFQKC